MAMFRWLWIRKFVRKRTQPIPYKKAYRWRDRLSIVYAIIGWNILGVIAWEYYQGRGTKEAYGGKMTEIDMLSPAQRFALKAGMEKATIYRSKTLESVEFNIDEYKHLLENEDDKKNAIVDENDTDNVA